MRRLKPPVGISLQSSADVDPFHARHHPVEHGKQRRFRRRICQASVPSRATDTRYPHDSSVRVRRRREAASSSAMSTWSSDSAGTTSAAKMGTCSETAHVRTVRVSERPSKHSRCSTQWVDPPDHATIGFHVAGIRDARLCTSASNGCRRSHGDYGTGARVVKKYRPPFMPTGSAPLPWPWPSWLPVRLGIPTAKLRRRCGAGELG